MISTYRTTHSTFWLLWPWFDKTKSTAPNHRSRLSRLQFWRPQWIWAPLKARRHRIQPQMKRPFIPKVSLNGSTRIILLMKHSTPISPDKFFPLQARPPHRRLHHDKRVSWAWRCLFFKRGECCSTPARPAASPYQPKRHPNAQGGTQILILLIRLLTNYS